MTYQTTARCPVCCTVFDTITHPHPEMDGQTGAMLLGECRSEHAQKSPSCRGHRDWSEGWTLDDPVYVSGPKLGDSRREGGDIYVYGMKGWNLFSAGNLPGTLIERVNLESVDVVSQSADQPGLAIRGTTTEAIDDYRGLLRRYIRHVFESEGSNFTDHDLDNTAVSFTPAEIAELRCLAAEGDKEAERIRDERVEKERDDEAKSARECCEDLGHPYEGP